MGVELLLMETLEELSKCDFEKFKWLLSTEVMDGCKPIPKSHLEDAPRTETVSKMAQKYDDDLAVNLTIEILRKMNMNNTAQKLKNTHTGAVDGGKTAASSTSSSASAPAVAPATISAQQGGVVIAPTVSGSTAGSWNITINKA